MPIFPCPQIGLTARWRPPRAPLGAQVKALENHGAAHGSSGPGRRAACRSEVQCADHRLPSRAFKVGWLYLGRYRLASKFGACARGQSMPPPHAWPQQPYNSHTYYLVRSRTMDVTGINKTTTAVTHIAGASRCVAGATRMCPEGRMPKAAGAQTVGRGSLSVSTWKDGAS